MMQYKSISHNNQRFSFFFKCKMLTSLPSEIIFNIFSFLTYDQVYEIRSVCKYFQYMGEYHIYQQVKSLKQTIQLKLDEHKNISMELTAKSYDPKNRVIEFVPKYNNNLSLVNNSKRFAYHRSLKIHFSMWNKLPKPELCLEHLEPEDQALFLYHYNYNSSIEKIYELPPHNKNQDKQTRYLGDKGLIVSMSYQPKKTIISKSNTPSITSLPLSSRGYPTSRAITTSSTSPSVNIKWIRVTLDWIISGLRPSIPTNQIYESSFLQLNQVLAKEGYFKYDPLSEPVLDHIIRQQDHDCLTQELPQTLLDYIHSHTHECHTRLSRLQHMLEGAGVDAQVLWKYTFAKAFVVGSGSLLGEEGIVRRIQDCEEEWRQKKLSFVRKLKGFPL